MNLARLWRAIAHAERIHATNHARNLGTIRKTLENLQTGIDGETFEVDDRRSAGYLSGLFRFKDLI